MEGRGRKNKFKEQRHQGKWSALLQGLQEKEPWRKGSRGSGHQERLGGEQSTTQFLLCLCVCGAEQEWISGQVGVGRRDALLAHFWRGGGCVLEMMRASERAPVKETMFHGPRDGWPSLASPRAATKKKKKSSWPWPSPYPRVITAMAAHRLPSLGIESARLTSQGARGILERTSTTAESEQIGGDWEAMQSLQGDPKTTNNREKW